MVMPSFTVSSDHRRELWLAFLVLASVVTTLGFACAVPLAALAAAAALTLSRRDAFLLVGAVWFANQAVGFTVLDYPWTANCIAWGVALGAVALFSTVASLFVAQRIEGIGSALVQLSAFLAAFVVYEGSCFLFSIVLGGIEDFAPTIIGQVFVLNAVGMVVLLVASRLAAAVGLIAPTRLRSGHAQGHA
jgi:hypothetical protein